MALGLKYHLVVLKTFQDFFSRLAISCFIWEASFSYIDVFSPFCLAHPISEANSLRLDCSCCNFKTASRLCVSTSIILSEIGAIFRFFRASRSASGNSLIHFISNIVYTNTISCTREYIINLYIIPIMDSFFREFRYSIEQNEFFTWYICAISETSVNKEKSVPVKKLWIFRLFNSFIRLFLLFWSRCIMRSKRTGYRCVWFYRFWLLQE